MQYSFNCYGHKNITARHKTTLEFTKDTNVSLNGDCIVGVKADFSLKDIKKFIENKINNQKFDKIKDYNSLKKEFKINKKINRYKTIINNNSETENKTSMKDLSLSQLSKKTIDENKPLKIDYNSIKKLKNKIIKNRINKNNSILKTNNSINKNAINNLKIKNEISNRKTNKIPIKIIIKVSNIKEEINGFLNPYFDDEREIVIRKSGFVSERTLTVNSNKVADDLKNEMKNLLKNDEKKINILLK